MGSSSEHEKWSKEEIIRHLKLLEDKNNRLESELTERKKELQAVYSLSSLMEQPEISLAEIFQKTADSIPPGWQYPEVTCARIKVGNEEYKTANFEVSEWQQLETFYINDEPGGTVEVFYLEPKPEEHEGPFLREERALLKVIAEKLGKKVSQIFFERQFEIVFRESPEAKCIIDLDRNYQFADVNQVFEKLSGYSREELIGKRPSQLKLFKDSEVVEKMLTDIKVRGEIKNLQYKYVTKAGETGSAILNATVTNIHGRNLAIASFVDLTEISLLKKAEQETNEFNRVLVESLPFGMEVVDKEGKILFANSLMKKLFGDDIVGQSCWHAYRNNGKPCNGCPLKEKIVVGETNVVEAEGIKGGLIMQINHTGFLYKGQMAILKLFVDVTEKRKAERELIEIKEKLENIFVGMEDAYFQIDLQGNIVYLNPAAPKMFGYSSAEEMQGVHVSKLWASEEERQQLHKDLSRSGSVHDKTYRAVRKDGSEFWVSMNAGFALDEKGAVKGRQGLIRDISYRMEIEEELVKAKERAEESDRLKSAFLANMSHEIRTPMNGIMGFANLLKEPGMSAESQQRFVVMIEKSGERMLNIIQEIIDISKIESGQMQIHLKEIGINEHMEDICRIMKIDADRKGIGLTCKKGSPDREIKICTDWDKLYSILTNLIKNAIKFTDKGRVECGYSIHDSHLEFFVSDTGIGIPADRQAAVFNRFVQADITDVEAREGAGLGLAISKAFVEMLGGKIWLESLEGTGSTFRFTISFQPVLNDQVRS